MKILFINHKSEMHHKNLHFILNCKKINFHIITNVNNLHHYNLHDYDAIYSTNHEIDVSKYPNSKFIFGPQFSIFPDNRLHVIKGDKTVYNPLSSWVINCWKQFPICNNLRLVALPFGVDTEKFINSKPIQDRNKVIVYFKHRNPNDLHSIETFLKTKKINYEIFSYDKRYNENDYLNTLQDTKYCIWVDAHESQGFALQEALSCNVPLLVWNITSMNQEYGSNYDNIAATTIPYWDASCGEVFYSMDEFENTYNTFITNIENYNPRTFIVDNLSIDVCETRLMDMIKSF